MSLAALKAGKHVACTVPMATNIADCRKIVDLAQRTGLKYMMMETVVYSREYLFMKELLDKLTLTRLHFIGLSLGGPITASFIQQYPEYANNPGLCLVLHRHQFFYSEHN